MTVLLEYLDLSISAGRAQLRFEGPSPALDHTNEKQTWHLKALLKFRGMLLYNMPIMPALCPKLAYYASIMLDALACLLCLKLCRHNRRRPRHCIYPTCDLRRIVMSYYTHVRPGSRYRLYKVNC